MKCAMVFLAFACGVLSSPIEDEAIKEFVHGNHQFSSGVYSEMAKYEKGSFVVSPISAETILALTHEGARGETAVELVSGLHLPNTVQKTQYAFKTFVPTFQRADDSLKFYSANKIYAAAHVQLKDTFAEVAKNVYYSEIANIDFTKNEQAAGAINKWVEGHTDNKIHDLVTPTSISQDTKLILVNTLYFKGEWVHQFNAERTKAKMFYRSPGVGIEVPTMSQIEHFNYYDHPSLNAQFLELPYAGGNISMVIVLPHEGHEITKLEEHLDDLMEPHPFRKEKIDLELPKFKRETEIKFVPILEKMGIKNAFKKDADFSGLSDKEVHISDVLQKVFISVDEKGTEATAATVVTVVGTSVDVSDPISFKANRPFIYYITYNGVITFFGRVLNCSY